MPRAGSNHREYNARHEAKKKALGYVRGPRITADAAEALRALAFKHHLTHEQVVSRLLLEIPLAASLPRPSKIPHGLSEAELKAWGSVP